MSKDLETKRQTYAAAQVPEYWIVDLKHRRVTVLRKLADGNYRSEQTLTAGEITPITFPNVIVSVQWLLEGF